MEDQARTLEWVAVPSSGDLPEPGVEPMSLALAGRFFTTSTTWEAGPQLARTGASQGFPRAAAPVGVFSRGTTRISGSLSCGARAHSLRPHESQHARPP